MTAPDIDTEAIAWALRKLMNFGVQNSSMDNALMMDRLNLMLQESRAPAAVPPDMQRDAARYRWLRRWYSELLCHASRSGALVQLVKELTQPEQFTPEMLDAAVDAEVERDFESFDFSTARPATEEETAAIDAAIHDAAPGPGESNGT